LGNGFTYQSGLKESIIIMFMEEQKYFVAEEEK
jgi:hypothetical protein